MSYPVIPKRWVPKPDPDESIVQALAESLQVNESLTKLMVQRSIQSFEDARQFFNPTLEATWDPFLMKDFKPAVYRIQQAIANEETILLYGDYDVDGTTAVAMVYSYLKNLTPKLLYYVPDRFKEGYGVSYQGINYATQQGVSLMIVLDCGIKAHEQIRYAQEQGIQSIICDHHLPDESVPEAYSVLNPKQPGCSYPYKELSGCGIGFKLIQGLEKVVTDAPPAGNYLDFVAVSSASDIVEITGENRILTHQGLKVINEAPNPAFEALIELSGLQTELTVTDLVFRIGPRINAAGRIAHAKNAVDLLVASNKEEALQRAQNINNQNTQRQQVDQTIRDEALKRIHEDEALQKSYTTVLYNEEWHKGVIGIVASRIMDHYYRPTILLTHSNGMAVGSGRSVPGFNLYEALQSCGDLLEQFGGHQGAAGLSLHPDNLQAFADRFEQVVRETIHPDHLVPAIEYDLEIPLGIISRSFVKSILRFGPFGPGNMKPVLVAKEVRLAYNPKIVGEHHLKLALQQRDSAVFDAIAFNQASFYDHVKDGKPFDICFTLEENTWNGKTRIQLNVKDIKTAGTG